MPSLPSLADDGQMPSGLQTVLDAAWLSDVHDRGRSCLEQAGLAATPCKTQHTDTCSAGSQAVAVLSHSAPSPVNRLL